VSAYVFMKLLESSPSRYDAGMEILTLGEDKAIKGMIAAEMISPGDRVLDLGCGTGTLAILCAKRGAGRCNRRLEGYDPSCQVQGIQGRS